MKSLVIVFSTFSVESRGEIYNIARQNEYVSCYGQLDRVVPSEFDILYVDNSIQNLEELKSNTLREFLKTKSFILTKQNFGGRNKGVGELVMLVQASQVVDFSKYHTICYCTGRKFFTCPYPFEKAISSDKEAVVSNPDFLFLDGRFREVAKGMFNDMFFAMKSQTMINFVEYTKPRLQTMEQFMINSETNLYQFIQENHVSHQVLPSLGIIRNEQAISDPYDSIENFHIC